MRISDWSSDVCSSDLALTHFMALRYGVFIHWNPATVAGKEISWSREREIPSAEYDQLYKRFNPVEFDDDAWVRMLKDAGFRHLTFVPKHHDGCALWDTKTSDNSIMNPPFGRDEVTEASASGKKHKLAFGFYASIADL